MNRHLYEDLNDLMLPFVFDLPDTSLVYVDTMEQLIELKTFLLDSILVGIDTERKPDHSNQMSPYPTALIQIAARTSTGEEKVFLIDLLQLMTKSTMINELQIILKSLLINEHCVKLGQGLVRDLMEIMISYPDLSNCFEEVNALVETESLFRILQPYTIHMISLKKLVKNHLHLNLLKTEQVSDWSQRPLTRSQLMYAANDALVLLRLHDAMIWEIQDKYILEEEENEFELKVIYQSLNLKENNQFAQFNAQWKQPLSPKKKSNQKSPKRTHSPVTVAVTEPSLAVNSSNKKIKTAV